MLELTSSKLSERDESTCSRQIRRENHAQSILHFHLSVILSIYHLPLSNVKKDFDNGI